MKARHFVIIGSVVVIIILMIVTLNKNKSDEKTAKKSEVIPHYAVTKVKNDTFQYEVSSHGIINASTQIPISVEVQGKMLPGDVAFKEGVEFRKGQVLCRIDNEEFLYTLAARKSSYINLIANILPDIRLDYPDEYDKWKNYLENITLNKLLPEMPMWNSKKEKIFLASKNIITEYFTIKSQEKIAAKYVIRAPFNGMIISTTTQPYATVSPGAQLAVIMETKNYELKAPFQIDDMEYIDKNVQAKVFHANGSEIGWAKVKRISDVINSNTQSVDVYLEIDPNDDVQIRSGQYVNVKITTESVPNVFEVPRKALTNNKIYTYNVSDSLLHPQEVGVIRTLKDSYLVRGIANQSLLVIDRVEDYNDTIKVGIIEK